MGSEVYFLVLYAEFFLDTVPVILDLHRSPNHPSPQSLNPVHPLIQYPEAIIKYPESQDPSIPLTNTLPNCNVQERLRKG